MPGTGQLERGARGGESESCDDCPLTAGDPTASSHQQAFPVPHRRQSVPPGGQKSR